MAVQMRYVVTYKPRGGKARYVQVGFSESFPRDPSEEGACVKGYDSSLPRVTLAEFKRLSGDLPQNFVSMVEEMLKRPPRGKTVSLRQRVRKGKTTITITVKN